MNTSLKFGIALAVIAILLGVFAGVLAITVDLSQLRNNFWIIVSVLLAFIVVLMIAAYKKGRLPIT